MINIQHGKIEHSLIVHYKVSLPSYHQPKDNSGSGTIFGQGGRGGAKPETPN